MQTDKVISRRMVGSKSTSNLDTTILRQAERSQLLDNLVVLMTSAADNLREVSTAATRPANMHGSGGSSATAGHAFVDFATFITPALKQVADLVPTYTGILAATTDHTPDTPQSTRQSEKQMVGAQAVATLLMTVLQSCSMQPQAAGAAAGLYDAYTWHVAEAILCILVEYTFNGFTDILPSLMVIATRMLDSDQVQTPQQRPIGQLLLSQGFVSTTVACLLAATASGVRGSSTSSSIGSIGGGSNSSEPLEAAVKAALHHNSSSGSAFNFEPDSAESQLLSLLKIDGRVMAAMVAVARMRRACFEGDAFTTNLMLMIRVCFGVQSKAQGVSDAGALQETDVPQTVDPELLALLPAILMRWPADTHSQPQFAERAVAALCTSFDVTKWWLHITQPTVSSQPSSGGSSSGNGGIVGSPADAGPSIRLQQQKFASMLEGMLPLVFGLHDLLATAVGNQVALCECSCSLNDLMCLLVGKAADLGASGNPSGNGSSIHVDSSSTTTPAATTTTSSSSADLLSTPNPALAFLQQSATRCCCCWRAL